MAAACGYRSPRRLEGVAELHRLVQQKKPRSLSYLIKFTNLGAEPPRKAVRGPLTAGSVAPNAEDGFAATKTRADWGAKKQVPPAALLECPRPALPPGGPSVRRGWAGQFAGANFSSARRSRRTVAAETPRPLTADANSRRARNASPGGA